MTEQETRTQLADLVRKRRAELRLSYERLSERCVDPETGTDVKGSWLHRLETGLPVHPPQLPQLRAMAVGLEVPLDVVQDAAGAQFFGIDTVPSTSGEARALVRYWERLAPDGQAKVIELLEAWAGDPDGESRPKLDGR